MKRLVIAVAAALGISGCGTANNYLAEKKKTVEYYRIFDIKTSANRQAVAKAASRGRLRKRKIKHAKPVAAAVAA